MGAETIAKAPCRPDGCPDTRIKEVGRVCDGELPRRDDMPRAKARDAMHFCHASDDFRAANIFASEAVVTASDIQTLVANTPDFHQAMHYVSFFAVGERMREHKQVADHWLSLQRSYSHVMLSTPYQGAHTPTVDSGQKSKPFLIKHGAACICVTHLFSHTDTKKRWLLP